MRPNPPLPIANQYGNVDASRLPWGYVHFPGARLSVTCNALGIDFSPARVGWEVVRGRHKAVINGVVVKEADAHRLREALAERDARRPTPAQREARRRREHERTTRAFATRIREMFPGMPEHEVVECARHATEPGTGRVGRVADINDRHVLLAVIAHARHQHTDYDEMMADCRSQEDVRVVIEEQLDDVLRDWRRRD